MKRMFGVVMSALLSLSILGCGSDPKQQPSDVMVDNGPSTDVPASQDGQGQDSETLEVHADVPTGDIPVPQIELRDLVQYVDPFIGTQGQGNVIPGPSLPHGMVKLSPDTVVETGSIDAYAWESTALQGFSHTHLQGPGGSGYGYSEILLLPLVQSPPESQDVSATFDHAQEEASAGYYAVTLTDSKIRAELTASAKAGFHRYTWPAGSESWVLLDVGHTRGQSRSGRIEWVALNEVRGFGDYTAHPMINVAMKVFGEDTSRRKVYFHARFSKPVSQVVFRKKGVTVPGGQEESPTLMEGPELSAGLRFQDLAENTLEVRVGISFIDAEQAKKNMEQEIGSATFDQTRQAASDTWNVALNRIQVEGGSAEDLTRFYTAVYHTLLAPTDYTEDDRYWIGYDGVGKVREAKGRRYYSDDFCNWDTFRTTHPLQNLLEPETASDRVLSYLAMHEEGGLLPKCPWQATGYNRIMIGNHALCIIADAWRKGFRQYDSDLAWQAMYKLATTANEGHYFTGLTAFSSEGTLPSYITKGYVPVEDEEVESASMTLEYAYGDGCIANMAQDLGKTKEEAHFRARSGNWRNHWDPLVGFMRPKLKNGDWLEPFDAKSQSGFCEADTWIYSWFVPQAPDELMDIMGGSTPFVERLDAFFQEGHFDVSNEPSFHVPYLYSTAGQQSKAQERLRQVLKDSFGTSPSGLPGNDDSGATSAWFVLSALGIYPVNPGDGLYWIGSPLFEKATLYLFQTGKTLVIEAKDNSDENVYIQSATLNGVPLNRATLTHAELVAGGTLTLQMGEVPSTWPAVR